MQTATRQPIESYSNTHWGETLSAYLDGERVDNWPVDLDTPAGRQTWDTYHLIGDVLRNPELAIQPSQAFSTRLSRAIEDEMPIVAAPRRKHLRVGLSGLAVAAAVASVVWVAQPYLSQEPPGSVQVLAEATPGAGASSPALGAYLEAHREVAGPSAVRQVSFEPGAMR
ncbi:Sigma factor RpoE negative regulatory protein RseA [plant metagenome]|uniref:Sigma factor RpoE negative regulatory protein RseA n=1 Tax=plant metagenome TaxID=1297885 RepID=A0A484RDJ0_9ZZZZ